jgi:hypothetical protein
MKAPPPGARRRGCVWRRPPAWPGLSALALVAVLASCSTPPGNAQTDRVAATVATAISSPRQRSADGLVRAALATTAGEQSDLVVIEAKDIDAHQIADPLARLVFRVHFDGAEKGFSSTDPITACYAAQFNFYGIVGSPRRIQCSRTATAIVPEPLPPQPRVAIPARFAGRLAKLLAAQPATPSARDVRARVVRDLPARRVDAQTGLRDVPPVVGAAVVSGDDIGVSLADPAGRRCLLGARVDAHVTVWRPTRIQLQPGELTCDPQTALHLQGTRAPH